MMIAMASIKKPASTATAMFCFSNISRRMLCFGVSTSTSTKAITKIAMPRNEYRMELTKAWDIVVV